MSPIAAYIFVGFNLLVGNAGLLERTRHNQPRRASTDDEETVGTVFHGLPLPPIQKASFQVGHGNSVFWDNAQNLMIAKS